MLKKLLLSFLALMLFLPTIAYAQDKTHATLTIQAVDSRNQPITGFVYDIVNKETGNRQQLSLLDQSEASIILENGTYTITEVVTPDKYEKSTDSQITIPWVEHGIIKPKHIEKPVVKVEKPKKHYANTGSHLDLTGVGVLVMGAIISGVMVLKGCMREEKTTD